ncbi:HNH endonuclease [Halomarina halobia]|uniref:HNH endonuclease n=1 Tax=Halomarina halobia TaxID=3033386 RepID=A0ABD6ABD3_9EURY|nr:HNH endonuclease [Halomarina sp. PSR21]
MSDKTELQRLILIERYNDPNVTQAEIARKLGCSSSYVSQVLRQYDSFDAIQARIDQLNHELGIEPANSHSGPQYDIGTVGSSDIDVDLEELEDLPPVGILVFAGIVGGFLSLNQPLNSMPRLQWGIVVVCVAIIVIVGIRFYQIQASQGLKEGVSWLITPSEQNSNDQSGKSTQAKTPPVSESLRNELYFERADRRCEWCEEHIDSPDVHHIEPRREQGPNEPDNLIVLCPNCHRKADSGSISRSKLRYRIEQQTH